MQTIDAASSFLLAKTLKGLTRTTLLNYRLRLEKFARAYPILPTRPEPIEAFLLRLPGGPYNRETYYRTLRAFYRWLVRRGHLRDNPINAIEVPRLPRREARWLSRHELQRLLCHPGHPHPVRVFLCLLTDTGLRLSEAHSITRQSFRGNFVVVEGKTGERLVPISPEVKRAVLNILPWPWKTANGAGQAVRRAFKRAGISGPRASAHTLRHTFCQHWTGSEAMLVGIMGWTSNRMLNVYRKYDVRAAWREHRRASLFRSVISLPREDL